jgi:hypothetical protein
MERLPAETKPETDKLEGFSTLVAELREIETECEVEDDLTDIHSCLLDVVRSNRYRLGEILHRYRVAVLRHGAWLPACEVFGRHLGKSSRTIREIARDYARVEGVPAEVIDELETAAIDPAAKRNAKVVEMAQQLTASGRSTADAVKVARVTKAKAVTAEKLAVWAGDHQLSQAERWTVRSFESQIKGVAKVPPDRKADILAKGAAVALWHLGMRKPVMVTPTRTIDSATMPDDSVPAAGSDEPAEGEIMFIQAQEGEDDFDDEDRPPTG